MSPARAADSGEPGASAVELPLELSGAEGCPERAEFLAWVRERAPGSRAPRGQRFVVELSVTPSGGEGRLRLLDESGEIRERRVVGRDCRDAAQALSLITALLLEPKEEPAAASPPPPERRPPPTEPTSPPPPAEGARLRVFAGALALGGAAPKLLFAGMAGLEWQRVGGGGWWAPRARLAGLWTEERAFAAGPGAVSFQQVGGALELCPFDLLPGPLSLHACAEGEVAALQAAGWGADVVQAHSVPFGALGAGLLLGAGLGGAFRFELRGALLASLARDRFFFDGALVHELPALVMRLGGELSFELGP